MKALAWHRRSLLGTEFSVSAAHLGTLMVWVRKALDVLPGLRNFALTGLVALGRKR